MLAIFRAAAVFFQKVALLVRLKFGILITDRTDNRITA